MPKFEMVDGKLRAVADQSNPKEAAILLRNELKGQNRKVNTYTRPQLEELAVTLAKALDIDIEL
jgi:hypothetical protein